MRSRDAPNASIGVGVSSACARGDARDVIPGDRATVFDDERFVSFGFAASRASRWRGGTVWWRTGVDGMMGDASVWSSLLTVESNLISSINPSEREID